MGITHFIKDTYDWHSVCQSTSSATVAIISIELAQFKMATKCSSKCTKSIHQQPSVTSQPEQHTPQPVYDFVEQPDQDYFCPVSFELLTQPHQTTCCGNHISQQAADRLIREGKHCPLCKNENFATNEDMYFKRNSINKLKVYCSHKKSKCKWTGELGDLKQHTTFCPKRPWKCLYCSFQSTHSKAITDHTLQCDYQPVPCPNHCEIGTVPRCHVEKHLLTCPLQLVDCEFASVGCDLRVPRKDLAGPMTENAQHHLVTATLLNVRLTKDLHQKMEEKDQQIIQLQTQLQQLDKKVDTKFQEIATKLEQLQDAKVASKTSEVKPKAEPDKKALLISRGFICFEVTIEQFTQCQLNIDHERWVSKFSIYEYPFLMQVFTNGHRNGRGTHLSASLLKKHTIDKTGGTAVLQMLNQLGDQGHFTGREITISRKNYLILFGEKFFSLANLGYNEASNTQYLKDNCLKFRLFLKVHE